MPREQPGLGTKPKSGQNTQFDAKLHDRDWHKNCIHVPA